MPELPEAENIRLALARVLPGRVITRVEVFSPKMRTGISVLTTAGLEGCKFTAVRRRGRYLIAELDDGRGLLMHLGMSGVIRVESAAVPKRKHEHVFLHLDDGRIFRFECTRRFSLLEVHTLDAQSRLPEVLNSLGVEPLEENFTAEYLFQESRNRSIAVKSFLMDNAVVVGIGNIYVTESLFSAGILPMRKAKELTLAEYCLIITEVRRILKWAIALGGSSISDFLNVDGSEGKFARELQIYGKSGKACPRCKKILKTVKLNGRSSCFCPECQK